MMYDREVLIAVALVSSMLTAIPVVLLALLAGPRQRRQEEPQAEERATPQARQQWQPLDYEDGFRWGRDHE